MSTIDDTIDALDEAIAAMWQASMVAAESPAARVHAIQAAGTSATELLADLCYSGDSLTTAQAAIAAAVAQAVAAVGGNLPDVSAHIATARSAATADAAPAPGHQLRSERGAANGYASLGADGKVPAGQLPSAGSGSANFAQATVDFGFPAGREDSTTSAPVAASWVTAGSKIVCTPSGIATADHDPDDYMVEGISAYPANIVPGVGFDILAHAPRGTWGRYTINATG